MPHVHVETPRYAGATTFVKRALDLVMSTLAVVLLSPVLIGIAIAIKLGSPGPVLFRQERIGLAGRRFTMLKFRTMVVDAEAQLESLMDVDRSEGNAVLFKMKHDPRVTRIGRLLRTTSLDELPQLFNVIGGSMSVIGPRPPLQREVDLYDSHVHRRFYVKPGITGLWQVSGRSTLSWDESVRLDLYYVENWSLANDFVILLRTIRVVFARAGAY
jgi:exopolysaccharide biosynthesis polyprenyl glycosylphosphotransferase